MVELPLAGYVAAGQPIEAIQQDQERSFGWKAARKLLNTFAIDPEKDRCLISGSVDSDPIKESFHYDAGARSIPSPISSDQFLGSVCEIFRSLP